MLNGRQCPGTGACLLYGIARIVIGENRTFLGGEDYLRSRGVEVVVLDDPRCKELMDRFIAEKPELWSVTDRACMSNMSIYGRLTRIPGTRTLASRSASTPKKASSSRVAALPRDGTIALDRIGRQGNLWTRPPSEATPGCRGGGPRDGREARERKGRLHAPCNTTCIPPILNRGTSFQLRANGVYDRDIEHFAFL